MACDFSALTQRREVAKGGLQNFASLRESLPDDGLPNRTPSPLRCFASFHVYRQLFINTKRSHAVLVWPAKHRLPALTDFPPTIRPHTRIGSSRENPLLFLLPKNHNRFVLISGLLVTPEVRIATSTISPCLHDQQQRARHVFRLSREITDRLHQPR